MHVDTLTPVLHLSNLNQTHIIQPLARPLGCHKISECHEGAPEALTSPFSMIQAPTLLIVTVLQVPTLTRCWSARDTPVVKRTSSARSRTASRQCSRYG